VSFAAAALAAVTLLTACRSPKSEFSSTYGPSSAITATATTSTAPASSSAAPVSYPTVVTAANLAKVLVTVSDLPTGWTATTTPSALALGQAGCLTPASGRSSTKTSKYVAFADAGSTPIFAESLALVGTAKAASVYAAGVKILNACATIKMTSGKTTYSGPLLATSFPTIGIQSKAYTLTITSGTHVLTEYVLLSEGPGVVMMTSLVAVSNPDITAFQSLCTAASGKL